MEAFELPALEQLEAPLPVPGTRVGDLGPAACAVDLEAEVAAAREAGMAAGRAEAVARIEPAVAALQEAAAALAAQRARVAADVEPQAAELALRIAEQVLAGALAVEPERVADVVRGALRRLVERERVTVLVHPDDLEAVRDAAPRLIAELGGMEHCEVQAERRVTRGGALVRTGEGEVDATLETKLARVREVVREALAPAAPEQDPPTPIA